MSNKEAARRIQKATGMSPFVAERFLSDGMSEEAIIEMRLRTNVAISIVMRMPEGERSVWFNKYLNVTPEEAREMELEVIERDEDNRKKEAVNGKS